MDKHYQSILIIHGTFIYTCNINQKYSRNILFYLGHYFPWNYEAIIDSAQSDAHLTSVSVASINNTICTAPDTEIWPAIIQCCHTMTRFYVRTDSYFIVIEFFCVKKVLFNPAGWVRCISYDYVNLF